MPRTYQRKTSRKSRRPKLNIGGIRGRDRFSVSLKIDWQKLEHVYRPLSEQAREQILETLKEYIVQDEVEHNAPFLHDAQAKFSRLNTHATELLKEHERRTSADKAVLSNVEAQLSCNVVVALENYLDAIATAQWQVNEDSRTKGFIEGTAWRTMVWRLFDVVDELGLPSTVTKPPKESAPRSAFVALVEEVQKQLPQMKWAFPATHQALAAAIASVRRKRKESAQRQEVITPGRAN